MYFSRFAQRLRAHDWTAALIELFIVILGILIALQVSNWNQDRIDAARGQRYTQRIHDDVQTDIQNMAKARAFWKLVAGFGKQALAHGEHGTLVDDSPWKTVLAYYQAGQILPFELDDTTFNELRDAGDLGLIEDEDLRYWYVWLGVSDKVLDSTEAAAQALSAKSLLPTQR